MTARAALVMVLLAACASKPPQHDEVHASRADVTASLYRQLEFVLEQQSALADQVDDAAMAERAQLLRLAIDIAVSIVRIDPDADRDILADRINDAR